jgi:hypothetical protein
MSVLDDLAAEVHALGGSELVEVLYRNDRLVDESQVVHLREMLTAIFKLEAAAQVEELLRIDDSLHVYWKRKGASEDNAVFGEFHLRTPILFGPKNDLNETYKSKKYDGVNLHDTRVFDYYAYNGGPIYSLLPVHNGRIDDTVLVFNEKAVFSTTLTCSAYLEQLRRTRGVLFWQYLFCKDAKVESYELDALKRGLEFIARVFPKDDFSDLQRGLQALTKR